jgi:hypothetical protein
MTLALVAGGSGASGALAWVILGFGLGWGIG